MVVWKMMANVYKAALEDDENILNLDYDDGYTTL